jgi:hypothetical protein
MKTRLFRLRHLSLAGATALLLAGFPGPAHAVFVFTLTQLGADVVVAGSGTLNTTALTLGSTTTLSSEVFPAFGVVYSGATSSAVNSYSGLTGPAYSFGPDGPTDATTGAGDFVGIVEFLGPDLYVPTGYVSGTALLDTSTYANATLSSLGFTPGSYTFHWGAGATADSLIVDIVPEPSTWAAVLSGAGLLGVALRRRRTHHA